ncbi:ATP-dependent DEAD/H RNA helicase [Novymonas esmeraldas]|uniref:ATP-dependent DEAD/H RNA helicase n=1 Tax=Novymonas esmeraldas TaxID=1808958 RepID=A0AAW0EN79_9TRYP
MHPGRQFKGDRYRRGPPNNRNDGQPVYGQAPQAPVAAGGYGGVQGAREQGAPFYSGRGGGPRYDHAGGPRGGGAATRPWQQPAGFGDTRGPSVDKNDVSTWRRKDFHELVKAFVENKDSNELSFPSTLDSAQRNMVHRIAMTFNLDHKSSGEGADRQLKLTKIGGTIDALKRQQDAAESGVRIKSIDGYQGAQLLEHDHLSEKDVLALADGLKPHKSSMTAEIRAIATEPAVPRKQFRLRQGGLSAAPKLSRPVNGAQLSQFRMSLPAYRHGPEIVRAVQDNAVVVICGDTGCGKTTQIPQMLYDAGIFGKRDDVICTQPRRISALSVAQRVATERGEACGDSCGYVIRFENVTSANSRIIYQTTGILLRRLHTEPELRGVACIIVDEVHERDVETDFCLLLLRDRLRAQQEHPERFPLQLKLVVMSATVQIDALVEYFSGYNSGRKIPLISIPGTLFPVQEFFLEDVLRVLGASAAAAPAMALLASQGPQAQRSAAGQASKGNAALYEQLKSSVFDTFDRDVEALVPYDLVCDLIEKIHRDSQSRSESILVFLPGWAAISSIANRLKRSKIARELSILMLHSTLTTAEQQRVFDRPPRHYRKIVLATSIAETSITIDDIVYVIDSGLVKGTSYDPMGNTSALKATLIGKANGVQRRGRAGRCQPGVCFHLLPAAVYNALPDFLPPEIVRSPLEEVCLQLKAIESSQRCAQVLSRAMSAPPAEAVEHAVQFLTDMGAFTAAEEKMTNLGRALAELPTHPLLGKMLFTAACFGVLDTVATIAAGLSAKTPFIRPQAFEKNAAKENLLRIDHGVLSDHFCVVTLFTEWIRSGRSVQYAASHFADQTALRSLERTKQQFIRLVLQSSFAKGIASPEAHLSRYASNKGLVRLVLLWSLYPRLATIEYRANRDTQNPQVFCWDNKAAVFSMNSVLAFYKRRDFNTNSFVTFYDRMNLEAMLNVFDATAVSPIDVLLCLRQLTIRPLVDVPALFLQDSECKLAPPAYLDVDTLPNKENYSALFFDGDKKLYVAPKKLAGVLQTARECLDFFLATCIKNVRANKFPDALVRVLAQVVGYTITGVDAPTSAGVAATSVHMDPAILQVQLASEHLPAFARRDQRANSDSNDSDEDAPLIGEDDADDYLEHLTARQKACVTDAYGDLAVFRSDGAADLLQAARAAEGSTAIEETHRAGEKAAEGDGDDQDGGDEDADDEDDDDEDVIVANLNLAKMPLAQ